MICCGVACEFPLVGRSVHIYVVVVDQDVEDFFMALLCSVEQSRLAIRNKGAVGLEACFQQSAENMDVPG